MIPSVMSVWSLGNFLMDILFRMVRNRRIPNRCCFSTLL